MGRRGAAPYGEGRTWWMGTGTPDIRNGTCNAPTKKNARRGRRPDAPLPHHDNPKCPHDAPRERGTPMAPLNGPGRNTGKWGVEAPPPTVGTYMVEWGVRDAPGGPGRYTGKWGVEAPPPTVRDVHGGWEPAPPISAMAPVTHPRKRMPVGGGAPTPHYRTTITPNAPTTHPGKGGRPWHP